MYHEGNRALQDAFGSRALADRLEDRLRRDRFNDADAEFIGSLSFFFLATADAQGRPDCSFKGGPAGFAQVAAPDLLIFPDYDGNGMFKSLGNLGVNPHVGILFMAMGEAPKRLRVNGRARGGGRRPEDGGDPGRATAGQGDAARHPSPTARAMCRTCRWWRRPPMRRTRSRRPWSRPGRASNCSKAWCRRAGDSVPIGTSPAATR